MSVAAADHNTRGVDQYLGALGPPPGTPARHESWANTTLPVMYAQMRLAYAQVYAAGDQGPEHTTAADYLVQICPENIAAIGELLLRSHQELIRHLERALIEKVGVRCKMQASGVKW
jgi:hypothetical protein